MFVRSLLIISALLSLSACSTFKPADPYAKPTDLLFNNKEIETYPLQVSRDNRLCNDDKIDQQDCPIKFYIDDFKAGVFYINNKTTYYLKPNEYELTVKNCTNKCDTFNINITVNEQFQNVNLILTIDSDGKPIIIKSN